MTFSHPFFRMNCTASAHSILTFPLLFAFSFFDETRVKVLAASRASSKIGYNMVPATVAVAFPVRCGCLPRNIDHAIGWFDAGCGQGCPLSPSDYGPMGEVLVKVVTRAYPGVQTPSGLLHSVAWADDTAWLGGSQEDAEAIARALPSADDTWLWATTWPRCTSFVRGWKASSGLDSGAAGPQGLLHPQRGLGSQLGPVGSSRLQSALVPPHRSS